MVLVWWILIVALTYFSKSLAFLPTKQFISGRGELKEDWCVDLNVFRTFTDVTLYECADECMRRTRCLSFLYHSDMKFCMLRSEAEVIPPSIAGLYRLCLSSDIMTWNLAVIGPCATRPCDRKSRCESNYASFTCVVSECLHPLPMPDSKLVSSMMTVGSRNLYFCLHQYTVVGNRVITCTDSGTWTDSDFTCQQRCDFSANFNNAEIIHVSPRIYLENDTVDYACTNDYSRDEGYENEKLVCNSTGVWSEPHCVLTCLEPVIEHGGKNVGSSNASPYTEGEKFVVQCDSGYSPKEATTMKFSNTMRCIGGKWSLNIICT